jgi:hypothetical protein
MHTRLDATLHSLTPAIHQREAHAPIVLHDLSCSFHAHAARALHYTRTPLARRRRRRGPGGRIAQVMAEIGPALTALHAAAGGRLTRIEAFLCDLAPPPHTGQPMPPGMINQLVRARTHTRARTRDRPP